MDSLPQELRALPGLIAIDPGRMSQCIVATDEFVFVQRPLAGKEKLVALSGWLAPARKTERLLAGTEVEVVAEDANTFWARTPLLGDLGLQRQWKEKSRLQRLHECWPTIVATQKAMLLANKVSPDPPLALIKPPGNSGTVLRECSSAQKKAVLLALGVDIDTIANAPVAHLVGPVAIFHGDLSRRNMVAGPNGEFLAVDWEMAAIHPLLIELCHAVSVVLITEAETEIWPEAIRRCLPDISTLTQVPQEQVLATMFWTVAADSVLIADLPDNCFGYLLPGLQQIADMSRT